MNWLDIVLLIAIAGSTISGLRKGLSREVIGLISVLAALFLSAWFYGTAGGYLLPYCSSPAVANLGGFLLVFVAVIAAGALVTLLVSRMLKVTGLSLIDHVLGAAFGTVRGILISIALVMAIMAFAPGSKVPSAVVRSRLAPYMVDAARGFSVLAPRELKEGYRQAYAQVKAAWADAWKKGVRRMPNPEKAQNEREI